MEETIYKIKEKKDKLKGRISELDSLFGVDEDSSNNKNKIKKIKKKWEK